MLQHWREGSPLSEKQKHKMHFLSSSALIMVHCVTANHKLDLINNQKKGDLDQGVRTRLMRLAAQIPQDGESFLCKCKRLLKAWLKLAPCGCVHGQTCSPGCYMSRCAHLLLRLCLISGTQELNYRWSLHGNNPRFSPDLKFCLRES